MRCKDNLVNLQAIVTDLNTKSVSKVTSGKRVWNIPPDTLRSHFWSHKEN